MSVIGRIPYIELVIERLTTELLTDLSDSLDGAYKPVEKSLYNSDLLLTSDDKGIKPCILYLKPGLKGVSGILIYNNYTEGSNELEQCVFIEFTKHQKVQLYEINVSQLTYKLINDYCEIEEIRRILNDHLDIQHNEAVVRVVPTDIIGNGTEIQLAHDGTPISNQTPLKFKTINGISLIGNGDIETNTFVHVELTDVGGGVLKSTEAFTNHTLVAFEVETTGVHYGADFILHPYDDVSVCLVAFRIILNGTFNDAYANLDENGYIVITLGQTNIPEGATFKCHAIEFND